MRLRCQMSVGFADFAGLWVPDCGLGTGFSLWGCVNLSFWWAGAPWTVGVLVSDCVDLVWVQDLPSGVV